MTADHPRYLEALDLVDRGDVPSLKALLTSAPTLVRARCTSVEPPYDGYFHGATLLHHVAGNPVRGELPATIVEVAEVLLRAGADPEAGCGGGPSQPGTRGGTVLGLLTSGMQAHRQGLTEALLDVLLAHGAHLDPDGGMFGTLYHTVEHQGQREVARMLHERGVRADLPIAAGLGRLDLVRTFIDADGGPMPGANAIWARTAPGPAANTDADVLADALLAAAVNGWAEVVTWLLDRGAPIQAVRSWGQFPITPLHGAAWAGWPEVVTLLLDRGADPRAREPTHDGTPEEWAAHAGREHAVRAFRSARSAG